MDEATDEDGQGVLSRSRCYALVQRFVLAELKDDITKCGWVLIGPDSPEICFVAQDNLGY